MKISKSVIKLFTCLGISLILINRAAAQETFPSGILIGIGSNAQNGVKWGDGTLNITHNGSNGLNFYTNNALRMNILSNGNIGVGVLNPTRKLEVAGSMGITTSAYADFAILRTDNNAKLTFGITSNSTQGFISSSGSIKFLTNLSTTPKMNITETGRVGIGTTTPTAFVDIRNTTELAGTPIFAVNNTQANTSAHFYDNRPFSIRRFTSEEEAFMVHLQDTRTYITYKNDEINNSIAFRLINTDTEGSSTGAAANDQYVMVLHNLAGVPSVTIGTPNHQAGYALAVNGSIRTKEITVEANWPDYVFEKGYKLRSLDEIENYINQFGHLPEVPSAAEVKENGIALGEMQEILLKKIEELTLYTIEQNKENKEIKALLLKVMEENQELKRKIEMR